MSRDALKNIRGGSPTWWVATVASGFTTLFGLGYGLAIARSLPDAVGALILPCIAGSLSTILLAKHPRIAPHALDAYAMLRPWVVRLSMGLLALGFVAICVAAGLSGVEGGVVVAVVSGLFAAIFVFLVVRTWSGEFRVSGELFGIRLLDAPAEQPSLPTQPGPDDDTEAADTEAEWPPYDAPHRGSQG